MLSKSVHISENFYKVVTRIKLLKAEMAIKNGIGEFDSTREDRTSYTKHLTQHFIANDIPDA